MQSRFKQPGKIKPLAIEWNRKRCWAIYFQALRQHLDKETLEILRYHAKEWERIKRINTTIKY